MVTLRKKLGQYLIRWGVIDETQLNEALKIGKGAGKRVGQVLIELGYATEDNLAKALASQFNLEHINLDDVQEQISAAMADKAIPEEIIKKFLVLPLGKDNYGRTRLIVHDPMDLELMDLLRFRLNTEVETVIASRSTIKEYIDKALSDTASALDTAIKGLGGDEEDDDTGLSLVAGQDDGSGGDVKASDAPIIRLTKKLIGEAVQERASDIHIEPMADRVRVRYRVDGVCHERDNIPKRMQAPMITRIKILSGMKVDERRIPQDGRIKMKFGDTRIDFRVSTLPTLITANQWYCVFSGLIRYASVCPAWALSPITLKNSIKPSSGPTAFSW